MRRVFRNLVSFSVNNKEMENFNKVSGWWDPNGPMHMLYQYNYHRANFLISNLKQHSKIDRPPKPLLGLKVLDVGCGAGILSESLARLGANVLAIDPNETSIREAVSHKKDDETLQSLEYRQMTVEELIKIDKDFDLVTSMQVIEHVDKPDIFVESLSHALKDTGFMMLSTISRNWYSYLTHIVVAEYIARVVPPGTHDHAKFLNPQELDTFIRNAGCQTLSKRFLAVDLQGRLKQADQGSNYMIFARKLQSSKPTSS